MNMDVHTKAKSGKYGPQIFEANVKSLILTIGKALP